MIGKSGKTIERTIGVYMKCSPDERELLDRVAKQYGFTLTDTVVSAVRFLADGERPPCDRCESVWKLFDTSDVEAVGE